MSSTGNATATAPPTAVSGTEMSLACRDHIAKIDFTRAGLLSLITFLSDEKSTKAEQKIMRKLLYAIFKIRTKDDQQTHREQFALLLGNTANLKSSGGNIEAATAELVDKFSELVKQAKAKTGQLTGAEKRALGQYFPFFGVHTDAEPPCNNSTPPPTENSTPTKSTPTAVKRTAAAVSSPPAKRVKTAAPAAVENSIPDELENTTSILYELSSSDGEEADKPSPPSPPPPPPPQPPQQTKGRQRKSTTRKTVKTPAVIDDSDDTEHMSDDDSDITKKATKKTGGKQRRGKRMPIIEEDDDDDDDDQNKEANDDNDDDNYDDDDNDSGSRKKAMQREREQMNLLQSQNLVVADSDEDDDPNAIAAMRQRDGGETLGLMPVTYASVFHAPTFEHLTELSVDRVLIANGMLSIGLTGTRQHFGIANMQDLTDVVHTCAQDRFVRTVLQSGRSWLEDEVFFGIDYKDREKINAMGDICSSCGLYPDALLAFVQPAMSALLQHLYDTLPEPNVQKAFSSVLKDGQPTALKQTQVFDMMRDLHLSELGPDACIARMTKLAHDCINLLEAMCPLLHTLVLHDKLDQRVLIDATSFAPGTHIINKAQEHLVGAALLEPMKMLAAIDHMFEEISHTHPGIGKDNTVAAPDVDDLPRINNILNPKTAAKTSMGEKRHSLVTGYTLSSMERTTILTFARTLRELHYVACATVVVNIVERLIDTKQAQLARKTGNGAAPKTFVKHAETLKQQAHCLMLGDVDPFHAKHLNTFNALNNADHRHKVFFPNFNNMHRTIVDTFFVTLLKQKTVPAETDIGHWQVKFIKKPTGHAVVRTMLTSVFALLMAQFTITQLSHETTSNDTALASRKVKNVRNPTTNLRRPRLLFTTRFPRKDFQGTIFRLFYLLAEILPLYNKQPMQWG